MIETPKALAAYYDYLHMGPGRSLDKLLEMYQQKGKQAAPTVRRATLGKWCVEHNWVDRVAQEELKIERARLEALMEQSRQTGYANHMKRIMVLSDVVDKMQEDLLENGRMWLRGVKGIGKGENFQIVETDIFNDAEVKQLRGVFADIASEVGERQKNINLREEESQAMQDHKSRYEDLVGQIYGGSET